MCVDIKPGLKKNDTTAMIPATNKLVQGDEVKTAI